jgi:hypothetical protein
MGLDTSKRRYARVKREEYHGMLKGARIEF